MGAVKDYLERHFRHFNAAVVVDAATAWRAHVDRGGTMMLTMGGAMSTAELGISVAELIRRRKVHALCVTGANLEEDLCNLVAHDSYVRMPNYRDLTPEDEVGLLARGLNRVTDTCIPEEEAFRRIGAPMLDLWRRTEAEGKRLYPHEFFYELIRSRVLEKQYQIDPADSWLVAASEANLPVWVPGWEDSSFANVLVAHVIKGNVNGFSAFRTGLEAMADMVAWYRTESAAHAMGFFQIGGGITGDYPICVVPLIQQELHDPVPRWAYFCQISEASTSYGSYSGAIPNEKITWAKLDVDTPRFVIESDATIVFPLVAAHVLDQ